MVTLGSRAQRRRTATAKWNPSFFQSWALMLRNQIRRNPFFGFATPGREGRRGCVSFHSAVYCSRPRPPNSQSESTGNAHTASHIYLQQNQRRVQFARTILVSCKPVNLSNLCRVLYDVFYEQCTLLLLKENETGGAFATTTGSGKVPYKCTNIGGWS